MSGKGSAPRPIPDRDTFSNNFDAIFRKKKEKTEEASSAKASSKGDSNENKDT